LKSPELQCNSLEGSGVNTVYLTNQ
jgi:hypothetical protein